MILSRVVLVVHVWWFGFVLAEFDHSHDVFIKAVYFFYFFFSVYVSQVSFSAEVDVILIVFVVELPAIHNNLYQFMNVVSVFHFGIVYSEFADSAKSWAVYFEHCSVSVSVLINVLKIQHIYEYVVLHEDTHLRLVFRLVVAARMLHCLYL